MREQVKEFMTVYGQYPSDLGFVSTLNLGFKLIDEEVQELQASSSTIDVMDAIVDILYVCNWNFVAFEYDEFDFEFGPQEPTTPEQFWEDVSLINTNDLSTATTLEEYLDAVADLTFKVLKVGSLFPLEAAFNEVHASNMSKLDSDGKPIKNHYGKILKGPNYFKPNLGQFVTQIAWLEGEDENSHTDSTRSS